MKKLCRTLMFLLMVIVLFAASSVIAHAVLMWSGCIWTSTASFGVSFVAGLGLAFPIVQLAWDSITSLM